MRVINLAISLFSIIKTKALECVSVVNVGEAKMNVVEVVIRSMNLWKNCAFLISLME